MSFSELGLSEGVLRAVVEAGYEHPTPIQKQAIPQVLMGRDVLGCAQTGTGKTASFTLPMIDILSEGRPRARMPRSLILEPTRELAAQVEQNFATYGKYSKLSTALLIGGVSFSDQEKKLDRGVEVLIATPGRLLDHFGRGKVLLNDVGFLVIDEADRMLDMGFIPDVERIVSLVTKSHQTLLFSATMPPEIRRLADRFLKNPKEISVSPPATVAETVEQAMVVVAQHDKRAALRALLRTQPVRNALIFCNRKRDIGVLHRSLERHGFSVGALHGDMDQFQRMATLDKFKKNEIALLVCSDVAARGLDIAGVSHVFNFDVPSHAEDYVHRTGRTGRAGRAGRAFTLATPEDSKYIAAIRRLVGKEIPRVDIEEVAGAQLHEEEGRSRRRTRGEKPGKREATRKTENTAKGEIREDRPNHRKDEKAGKGEKREAREGRSGRHKEEKAGKRGRGGSRRGRNDAGDAPDYKDTPFGETDQVPDFLKRRAGV